MGEAKSTAPGQGGGDGLLSAFDARVRQIAAEVFRSMAETTEVGAVRVKTAARLLDMCESRVRTLIAEGKLKAVRPTPKTIRITRAEIRRYLEEQTPEGK